MELLLRDINGHYSTAYIGAFTDTRGRKGVTLEIVDNGCFSFMTVLDLASARNLFKALSEALEKVGQKVTVKVEGSVL